MLKNDIEKTEKKSIMKKKILSVLLTIVIMLGFIPVVTVNAVDINYSSVFVKQSASGRCTLASAVMMLRRRAIIDGNANWASITESTLEPTAWTSSGIRASFTYAGMTVNRFPTDRWTGTASQKKTTLISLLNNHPEGIMVWTSSPAHAVLITDYQQSTDTFYCADPANNISHGRIPLTSAYLPGATQNARLESLDRYWYITNKSGGGPGLPTQPPGAPTAFTAKSIYAKGENIILNWHAVSNVTHYWVDVWSPVHGFAVSQNVGLAAPLHFSCNNAGDYIITVYANNSAGSTASNTVKITIYDTVPTSPIAFTAKSAYAKGENIILNWHAVPNVTHYWVDVFSPVHGFAVSQNVGLSAPLQFSCDKVGDYIITVYANNSLGSTASNTVRISIYDTEPISPTVTTEKLIYAKDETITANWAAVPNATYYWISVWSSVHGFAIDKNVELSTSYQFTCDNIGEYRIIVYASNSLGSTPSSNVRIDIIDENEIANNNSDISAVKTLIQNTNFGSVLQTTLNTKEQAKTYIENIITELNLNGVNTDVINGTFTAAIAGTAGNINGANGSYTFTVNLNKGLGTPQTTTTLNLTITATKYVPPASTKYKVAFNSDGGTAVFQQEIENGKQIITAPTTTKNGFNFDGWYDGNNKINFPYTVTKTVTLTAKWIPIKSDEQNQITPPITYTVIFKNGNKTLKTQRNIQRGKSATAPKRPTKKGYIFNGWDKKFNNITQNLTVNAKWKPKTIKLSFNANKGKIDKKKTVTINNTFGKSIKLSKNPTRKGYKFKGWYTKKTGGIKITRRSKVPAINKIYYAQWKKK